MAAAALLLVVSLAAADMSSIISYEEETRRMFVEWKAKYGKTYKSAGGEEECRHAVFKGNRHVIVKLNAAADVAGEPRHTASTDSANAPTRRSRHAATGAGSGTARRWRGSRAPGARTTPPPTRTCWTPSTGGRRRERWPRLSC